MTSKEAYNYLLGLLELEDDIRWPLVKESMDKFKELIDQQSNPTLDECIKEWENEGFQVDIFSVNIDIYNYRIAKCKEDEVEFNIDLLSKQISMSNGCWASLSFKIYHLLSKTLKAWEVENGK